MSIQQLVADAERWNRWAMKVNERALAAGLVTRGELEANRMVTQRNLNQLRMRAQSEARVAHTPGPLPTQDTPLTEVSDAHAV